MPALYAHAVRHVPLLETSAQRCCVPPPIKSMYLRARERCVTTTNAVSVLASLPTIAMHRRRLAEPHDTMLTLFRLGTSYQHWRMRVCMLLPSHRCTCLMSCSEACERKQKREQNSCTSQQRFTDIGFGVFFFGTATGSVTQWIVPMPCLFCAQVQADKVKGMFEQIDLDGPGPASHVLWMTPPRACHVCRRSAADLGGRVCAPRA